MLFIISSRIDSADPHTTSLKKELKKIRIKFCEINTNYQCKDITYGYIKNKILIFYKGLEVTNPIFYLSSPLRADSSLMEGIPYEYPQVYRSSLSQFFYDLGLITSELWLPAPPQIVFQSDSKPYLLNKARAIGITVPNFTVNGNSLWTKRVLNGIHKDSYRKSLGYPFMLSSKVGKSKEVAITRLNTLSSECDGDDELLWQWQEPIESTHHIRCHIVGANVLSVITEKKGHTDIRSISDKDFLGLKWKSHLLPLDIQKKLIELNYETGLLFSSPEFLVDSKGNYILIDYNPCGDWIGFFNKDECKEILNQHILFIKNKLS